MYSTIHIIWASLVAQWSRICLTMQETRVRSLIGEDPTCHEATKPVRHNYRACALEPRNQSIGLKPTTTEPQPPSIFKRISFLMSLEIFASGYFFLNFPQYKPQNLLTGHPPLPGPMMNLVRPQTCLHVWETV